MNASVLPLHGLLQSIRGHSGSKTPVKLPQVKVSQVKVSQVKVSPVEVL